jgi:hypothetical protein
MAGVIKQLVFQLSSNPIYRGIAVAMELALLLSVLGRIPQALTARLDFERLIHFHDFCSDPTYNWVLSSN